MYIKKMIDELSTYWIELTATHIAVLIFAMWLMPRPNNRVVTPTPLPDTFYYKYTIGSEATGYTGIPDSLIPRYVATVDRLLNSRSIQGMKTCSDLGDYVSRVQSNTKNVYERRLSELYLYRTGVKKSSNGKETEQSTTKVEKYSSEELTILDSLKKYYLRGR